MDKQIRIRKLYLVYGRSEIVPICISKHGQNFLSDIFLIETRDGRDLRLIRNEKIRVRVLKSDLRTRIGTGLELA